jgi:hypothetical protein
MTFIPKCLNRKKPQFGHVSSGHITPCCFYVDDEIDQIPQLVQEKFDLDNVSSIEEILHSNEWQDFFLKIKNKDIDNLPEVCKHRCGNGASNVWKKSKEEYNFSDIKGINIDISNKCSNACPGCKRTYFKEVFGNIPGKDMSLKEFDMITDYFNVIVFSGQISDPTLNPHFLDFLKLAKSKNTYCQINVAATAKKESFWKEAFDITKDTNMKWIFAIDGLPETSHKYRINQDGPFLFEMMKLCKMMGNNTIWQFIPFSYNENEIEECRILADSIGVKFKLRWSERFDFGNWSESYKSYKPSKKP